MERYNIGKFKVSRVNLDTAVAEIEKAVADHRPGYVCVSNARSAYQSNSEEDYCAIQNKSLLTLPDGKPLSWIAHNLGLKDVGQVAGNDIFHALMRKSEIKGYSHFFYGSTPETIAGMVRNSAIDYPNAKIVGAVSPPFQPLEDYDITALAEEINEKKPTFLWIGLGAPKQERLMALLQPHLHETISLGIGLVFEYYGGTIKRAPLWASSLGMEWLFRSFQQRGRKRKPSFRQVFSWTVKEIIKSRLK